MQNWTNNYQIYMRKVTIISMNNAIVNGSHRTIVNVIRLKQWTLILNLCFERCCNMDWHNKHHWWINLLIKSPLSFSWVLNNFNNIWLNIQTFCCLFQTLNCANQQSTISITHKSNAFQLRFILLFHLMLTSQSRTVV